jgi:murein DD-endopeptidase MepM/ murein hydrolase activator NlpD
MLRSFFAGQQLFIPGAAATEIPDELPAPLTEIALKPLIFTEGETGSIRLTTASSVTITGIFLEQELRVIAEANNTQHRILVGIPIYTETGIYPAVFSITASDGTQTTYTLNIRVAAGAYTSQTLTISDELAPLLSQAPQDYELGLLQRLTSSFTPDRYFTGAFGLPAAAPMNSPFGTRRSYNGGIYTGYHTGADFASAPGSPIVAVAAGEVVLADLLNIRGNTVILDHGWGVFSAYSHQSQLSVQLGQKVTTGDIIGMAGATGRTTGPHLHWEVWVNGVPVNPLQWTQTIFP